MPGLRASVQVVRDTWGVPHISAQSVDDLFFAQGYVRRRTGCGRWRCGAAARKDGWRRSPGRRAVARDSHGAPADIPWTFDDAEWRSYHPDGKRIFTAYANGVNAFIAQHKDRLPVEFVVPGDSRAVDDRTLVLRAPSFGDAGAAAAAGAQRRARRRGEANRARNPDPPDELVVPNGLDVSAITEDVVTAAGRGAVGVGPLCRSCCRNTQRGERASLAKATEGRRVATHTSVREPGSNKLGRRALAFGDGPPVVANDPHREGQRTPRSATSSISSPPDGTSRGRGSRRLSAWRWATTNGSPGA